MTLCRGVTVLFYSFQQVNSFWSSWTLEGLFEPKQAQKLQHIVKTTGANLDCVDVENTLGFNDPNIVWARPGFFFTDFSATPTNGFAGFLSLGKNS